MQYRNEKILREILGGKSYSALKNRILLDVLKAFLIGIAVGAFVILLLK